MRILEKISNIATFFKPSKKAKHRTLLLLGSYGEVVSIRRFLGITVASTVVAVVTLVFIVYLFFVNSGLRSENKELKEKLNASLQQAGYLKNENDILMARLVAESEGGAGKFEPMEAVSEKPALDSSPDASMNPSNIETQYGDAEGKENHSGEAVEVGNLVVTHETDTETLRIRYDLKNTNPGETPVSGRTVVVLKTASSNHKEWLPLPFVPLVSGKPASTARGRAFLISRFKTVKFSIAGQTNPGRYKNATVFVFSKSGNTLVEKDFKIQVRTSVTPDTEQNEPMGG